MRSSNRSIRSTKAGSCSEVTLSSLAGGCSKFAQNSEVRMSKKKKIQWIRLPRHEWPKSWSNIQPPVVLLERNLYGHPLAGLFWERQFDKVLLGPGLEKYRIGNVSSFIENKDYSYRYTWMTCKWLKESRILSPRWRKLMKLVDLGEPTSFLDHVYLGCTQRERKPHESIIEEDRNMFESRISAGATEKLLGWEKPHTKTLAWSYDMEGHAKEVR